LELHKEMMSIYQSLCIENNPTSVKYILSLLGLCNQDTRPPLTSLSDSSKVFIKEVMQNLKQSLKIE
jgi:dihydrodipicolinate synthase/N-acetylneuraminate lyase